MDEQQSALAVVEPDWNAIQERYLDGESSFSLADEYGTTANAIRLRASKGRWKEKQLRHLEENELALGKEVRGCLLVSILREARMFRDTAPPTDCTALDVFSKVRERLLNTASKLLGWDRDAADDARHVRTIDI